MVYKACFQHWNKPTKVKNQRILEIYEVMTFSRAGPVDGACLCLRAHLLQVSILIDWELFCQTSISVLNNQTGFRRISEDV